MIDVFGDINLSGTGQPWEYLDGWAYRNNSTGPDGSTFALSSWSFSGPNALDGETLNSTAVSPIPVGTFAHNGLSTINNYTMDVTASSSTDYTFTGSFSGTDPAINVNLGDTLVFNVNTPNHPFWINTIQGTGTSNGVTVTNNGTSSGTITWVPTTAGTYYYNCEFHSMMTGSIIVSSGTTTISTNELSRMNIYPNPFRETLTVSDCVGCELKLYNLIGKLEHSEIVRTDRTILDTEHLAAGVYVLELTQGQEKQCRKVVKK